MNRAGLASVWSCIVMFLFGAVPYAIAAPTDVSLSSLIGSYLDDPDAVRA